jgi:hypothetical protein
MDPLKTGLIFSLKPIGSQQPPARPVNNQTSSIPIVPSVSSSNLAQPTPGNEGFVEPKLPIAVKTSLQDSFERLYRQTPLPAVLAGGMQTITASVPAYRLSAPFTNLNSITKKIDYGEQSVTDTPFQIPLPPMQEDFPARNEEVRAQAAPATAYRMSAPPGGLAQEQLMIPQMHPFMPSIAVSTPALQRTAEIAHAIQVENIYHQVMEKFRQNDRFIQSTQTPKHTFATQSKSRTVGSQTKLEDNERTQQNQNLPPQSNYSTKRSETKSIGVAATSYSPPHSDHQDDYPDYPTFEYDLPPSPPPIIEKEKPRTRPQVMSSSGMSSGSSYLAVTGSSSEQELSRRSPQKAKSSSAVIDRRRTPGTSVTSSSLVALAESSSEQDRRASKFPPRSAQRTPLERTRAPSSAIRQSQKNSLTDIVEDSSEQEALYSTDKFSSQRQHLQSSASQQQSPHKSPQREISVINNHTITASSSLSGLRNEKKQVASSSSSSLASIADVGKPSTPTTYSISASKAPASAEKKRIQPQLISAGKSDLLNVSISPATASRPAPTVRTRAPAQSRPAYTAPSSQSFVMDSLLSLGGDPVPQRPRSNPNTSVDVRARGMPISAASTESIRPRHKAQYEENNSLLSIAPSNVPQRAVPSSSSATTARQRATTTSSSNSNNNRTSYNPFELTSDQEIPQSKPTKKSSSQSSRPRYGDEGESLGEESEVNIGKRSVSSSKRRETSQYNLKDAGDDDIPFTTSSFLDSRTFSSPKPDSITSNGRIAKSLDKSLREAGNLSLISMKIYSSLILSSFHNSNHFQLLAATRRHCRHLHWSLHLLHPSPHLPSQRSLLEQSSHHSQHQRFLRNSRINQLKDDQRKIKLFYQILRLMMLYQLQRKPEKLPQPTTTMLQQPTKPQTTKTTRIPKQTSFEIFPKDYSNYPKNIILLIMTIEEQRIKLPMEIIRIMPQAIRNQLIGNLLNVLLYINSLQKPI